MMNGVKGGPPPQAGPSRTAGPRAGRAAAAADPVYSGCSLHPSQDCRQNVLGLCADGLRASPSDRKQRWCSP
uniref:Uncharacterized protein n=1 Tax=Ficus carica TaxID=3494 RepID=A0AA87YRB2_FICCA|nr:hypothetical protein TIFTF001_043184 [Ficus carica]GMN20854.1 hypothetical protein TIFTF001_043192 [Ficus carica]